MNERSVMTHRHRNAHAHCRLESGGHYEVCRCGATRKVNHLGKVDRGPVGGLHNAHNDRQGWHTCDLCVRKPLKGGRL